MSTQGSRRQADVARVRLDDWRQAVVSAGDLVYCWDLDSDQIHWGGDPERFFAMPGEALPATGAELHALMPDEDAERRRRALNAHLERAEPFDCEYRLQLTGGSVCWVHDRGAMHNIGGRSGRLFSGSLRSVTLRKRAQARTEFLASFDDLTGLLNRVRLQELLGDSIDSARRDNERQGTFLVVGLDALDRINTAYGYEVGDCVLVEVARRLERCQRGGDPIGRLSGDRFGIVLADCPGEQARHIAERILNFIRRYAITTPAGQIHVSVSIGMVGFPDQDANALGIMTKAEGALLSAKSAGRDCICVYELSEAQRRDFRENMGVGERVKQALKEGRLLLAYQPVIAADSGETRHYECLVRMRGSDGQLLPAGRFIPIVEKLGLMRMVDRHVLDMALTDLEYHPDVTLAVNISGLTAADPAWLRALTERLQRRPEVARRLIVEITETAALNDLEESARFVTKLRDLGCRVAVDDFGAGYTTFRHLRSLTVDVVKIDGSFVRGIDASPENQLFVRNLLSLSRSFNLETVAECVETAEEARYLAAEGLDLLQGFHFGRPDLSPEWRRPLAPLLELSHRLPLKTSPADFRGIRIPGQS